MKKYNFNLSTVLSIRENIEKEWEAKLGLANNQCQIIQNRINLLTSKLINSKSSKVEVADFQSKCVYEDRLAYQIKKENILLKEKELERDKVKEIYLQKSIDRKIIDKLKDKSIKTYKKEKIKDETMIIDELNSSSGIRERMLGGVV